MCKAFGHLNKNLFQIKDFKVKAMLTFWRNLVRERKRKETNEEKKKRERPMSTQYENKEQKVNNLPLDYTRRSCQWRKNPQSPGC
jgi:hypothetical protein